MGFTTQDTGNKVNIKTGALIRGLIIALLTSFILSFTLGGVLYLTSLSEAITPSLALISLGLSSLAGGWSAARSAGQGGLVHGALTGILFVVMSMILFSWLLIGDFNWLTALGKTLIALISAITGGILGVGKNR